MENEIELLIGKVTEFIETVENVSDAVQFIFFILPFPSPLNRKVEESLRLDHI